MKKNTIDITNSYYDSNDFRKELREMREFIASLLVSVNDDVVTASEVGARYFFLQNLEGHKFIDKKRR